MAILAYSSIVMAKAAPPKPAPRYVTRTYRVTLQQDAALYAALVAARMGELTGPLPSGGVEDLSGVVRAALDDWLEDHVPARILRAFQTQGRPQQGRGRSRQVGAAVAPKRGRRKVPPPAVGDHGAEQPVEPKAPVTEFEGAGHAR